MAYTLNSVTIKSPNRIVESNQDVSQVSLSLGNTRYKDITGENKRTWVLSYNYLSADEFTNIFNIYEEHLSDGEAKTLVIDETNFAVNTTVHISVGNRQFNKGGSYLSSIDLILTEA